LNPTSVVGGKSSTGTITLTGPAPAGGLTFTFGAGTGAGLGQQGQVTVPAGATHVTFHVVTFSSEDGTTVTVWASTTTGTSATVSAPLTVTS
jgi:hypothetical protein